MSEVVFRNFFEIRRMLLGLRPSIRNRYHRTESDIIKPTATSLMSNVAILGPRLNSVSSDWMLPLSDDNTCGVQRDPQIVYTAKNKNKKTVILTKSLQHTSISELLPAPHPIPSKYWPRKFPKRSLNSTELAMQLNTVHWRQALPVSDQSARWSNRKQDYPMADKYTGYYLQIWPTKTRLL